MDTSPTRTYTAFAGAQRVAHGDLGLIADALDPWHAGGERLLVFDDSTGAQVDTPPPPEHAAHRAAWRAAIEPPATKGADAVAGGAGGVPEAAPATKPAVGRPRLGVVPREVTLLPRHWEWLQAQPGGASATLRRLVDEARKQHAERDAQRVAVERAYRFMSAIASQRPHFEEASRALFAADSAALARCVADWPADIVAHLRWLAREAFTPVSLPAPAAASERTG